MSLVRTLTLNLYLNLEEKQAADLFETDKKIDDVVSAIYLYTNKPRAKNKTLHVFMENTNHTTAIRIWSNAFSMDKVTTPNGKEFTLYNLPFYYVRIIDALLAKWKV